MVQTENKHRYKRPKNMPLLLLTRAASRFPIPEPMIQKPKNLRSITPKER